MTVPFVSLAPQNELVRADVIGDVGHLITRGDFTDGNVVGAFERAWADYCGTEFCVGVSSGLDALRLALLALDLESGGEVVVPAMTFQATWEAVTQAGLVPVPADVDEDGLLDPAAMEAAVTERTQAVLPVHLYGRTAYSAAPIADRDIAVVEDASQAHGAFLDEAGPAAGSSAACFSFYPTKNLGAFGDAGAVVTNDSWLADRARALREHGQIVKGIHEFDGYTARLDTIQALVLLRKLPLLDGWNRQRRDAARFYAEALAGVGDLRLPPVGAGDVFHVYPVRTADPGGLAAFLAGRGIGSGRHYPVPPHLSPAYASLGHRAGEYPVAERIAAETLSLPLWPGISEAQQVEVCDGVKAWFDG